MSEKDHLVAQQNRAIFVMQQLVPKLQSIDEVLQLKVLVETKHAEDKNPYGFIRRELNALEFPRYRLKYGNTHPWEEIIKTIQTRLNELANGEKLTSTQYEDGKKIMKTHTQHDYGFGFLYTPSAANKWHKHKPAEERSAGPHMDSPKSH